MTAACCDVGVAQQGVLDLGRVGVEAADDEHVLRPARRCAGSRASSTHAEVAGAQPAVGGQRRGGGLGVVEVVRHDAAAPQQDLAGLAGRHVAPSPSTMRSSKPGRGRPTVVAIVSASSSGRGGRRGAALGEPVAGDDRRRTAARRSMRRMSSTGMSAAPVTATRRRRQVVAVAVGVVEDRLVERRRAGQHGDPLGGDAGQHPVDVEHRLGEHRRPGRDARRGSRPSARTCGSTG